MSNLDLPSGARVLLRRLSEVSVGESLFSDRADSVSFLFSNGAPLPAGTPSPIRKYATFLLGAAATLVEGWSILPPGVAGEDIIVFPPLPTAGQLRTALGSDEAERWMQLAAWTASEYTAQRALPLPRVIGLNDEGYSIASERWHALGTHLLAPAIAAYPDHARSLGVPDLLRRAADSLARPGAGAVVPGSALWQLNRENRLSLVRHMASRDAALIANMFALEESHADLPGSSILYSPEHLPRASRRQQLHPSALGVFSVGEWPLPSELLAGNELANARSALRRNALAFAADRPHLREFLFRSKLVDPEPWTQSDRLWELASVTLCAPGDAPGDRHLQDPDIFARAVAKRFSVPERSPADYLAFRQAALPYCDESNDLAFRLIGADACVLSEWTDEMRWGEAFLEGCRDVEERRRTQDRLSALRAAITEVAQPERTMPIARSALSAAAHRSDGNRVVKIAETLAGLLTGPERHQAGDLVLDALRDASGLSPTAIGAVCRSPLVSPDAVVAARLRRRVCGPRAETDSILGLGASQSEEASLARISSDLSATKGVYYVEHRMLSILESGSRDGRSPDPDLFSLLARYNPGETVKGREKELRSLFALIAAFDHERSDAPDHQQSVVLAAVAQAGSLREARHALAVSGQMSAEERILTLLTQATGSPRESFSAGVAHADPSTLNTLQDAHAARLCIASVPDARVRQQAGTVLHRAIGAYAHGDFQRWKYNHHLSEDQIGFATRGVRSLWQEDRAWSAEAFGTRFTVRESSDFGELLRHGDFPVKTCHAILGYGDRLGAGLSVLADSHSKLLQFIDPQSQRIVGRTIVRMFRRENGGNPLVIAEAPYTCTRSREAMAMRLVATSCLAEKFSETDVLVTQGVCASDRQSDVLPEAERHMGRMKLIPVDLPPTMVCAHYLDSNISVSNSSEVPEAGVVQLACLPDAVSMLHDCVSVRRLPGSSCRKDPQSLYCSLAAEDEEYEARCRSVFPDRSEREAFFAANPGAHLSGTIPRGHESAWRASIKRFPQLGSYLHHSDSVQSLLGGAPNPLGDGNDVRGALAIVEGRPYFRGVIHGMARDEIAAARSLWLAEVGNAMQAEPGRWPPEIDYLAIGKAVQSRVTPVVTQHQAFSSGTALPAKSIRPAPEPSPETLLRAPSLGA